jgi:hypothetical protein
MSVTPQSTRAAKNHAFQPLVATATAFPYRCKEEYFQPERDVVSTRAALVWLRCPLITATPGGRAEGSDGTPDQEIREETHSVVMQMSKRSTLCWPERQSQTHGSRTMKSAGKATKR